MGASACGDSARDIALIALLLPSLVDSADPDALRKTICTAANKVRLLVCVPEGSADRVLNMLQDVRAEIQILISQDIEQPQTDKFVVRAPPGMPHDDMLDFVLALSDVVLVSKGHETKRLAKYASDALGKTLITVGFPLHVPPAPIPDVTKVSIRKGAPGEHFVGDGSSRRSLSCWRFPVRVTGRAGAAGFCAASVANGTRAPILLLRNGGKRAPIRRLARRPH
jgi:hypothetical protein